MKQRVTVNPDLERERATPSFNVAELTHFFYGSKESADRYRYLDELIYSSSLYAGTTVRDKSRSEAVTEWFRRSASAMEVCKRNNITDPKERIYVVFRFMNGGDSAVIMHYMAFLPFLRLQASDEQLKVWEPLIESFQMFGCYAQTELGHGSFVRGLETTAVYDSRTKEFVLNTPKITSTKWWVGGLGKVSNCAVIMAQLYTRGVCHGVHAFLLPLRDSNHQPLPGITVGDIGPKLGTEGMDNGFLQLDNVRIPLGHMLMRYAKVLEDGTYVKPENDRIMYGGMLGIRAGIPFSAATQLATAVTIAVRYSCVRRQSELQSGQKEAQILDFRTQQHKLFPLMAMSYAFAAAGNALSDMFKDVMNEIQSGDFKRLIEAHGLSSGMKALVSSKTAAGIELCRTSCGGHGYLQASGFYNVYVGSVAAVTAEGEYTVLLLQTARYLMKNVAAVLMNKRIDNLTSYLIDKRVLEAKRFTGSIDLDSLLLAYAVRANRIVSSVADKIRVAVTEQGVQQEVALNRYSNQLVKAALAHVNYVVLRLFIERLGQVGLSSSSKKALTVLCTIHALYGLIENAGDLILEGYMTSVDVDALSDKLFSLYDAVRSDAVSYVDAFQLDGLTDSSVLGRYDGKVYESLIESAESSVLNKQTVHPSFKYFEKHREGLRSNL